MDDRNSISCRAFTVEEVYAPDVNTAKLRLNDRIEISFITSGSGICRILDEVGECTEGDLFVFDSGVPHDFFAKDDENKLSLCTVLFDPEETLADEYSKRVNAKFCYGIFRDKRPVSYSMLDAGYLGKVKNLFDSLFEECRRADFESETASKAYLLLLIIAISRYLSLADTVSSYRNTANPEEWTAVSIAIREIMNNVGNPGMTLDTIAATLFVSRSHLSRMFTKITGCSFTDYVRDIRLNRACELLRTTRLSNEEIVRNCGLKDIPSFYKLFKNFTGMTPYQYRLTKHSQEGEENMSIYFEISENLQKGKAKIVKELVAKAIEDGLPAGQILNEGLVSGMNILGEKFKNNEVYVPEVLVAARAMNAGMQLLKPLLIEDGIQSSGKVCIGTVEGDLHDIGKNLVKMMMEGKGLEVVDLGTDVAPQAFVQAAIDQNCQVICCSALLTTTMDVMADVVKAADAAGIRDKVKIMIGGAPITEEFCAKIGADCYTSDAASAADAAVELCKA